MKKSLYLLASMLTLLFVSCASTNTNSKELFSSTWELEYMSGPRIAFDGLFPDKKPFIKFNEATSEVNGNASCNGYASKYTLNGSAISFEEPGPTTMMYCGNGEGQFLNMIKKIDKFSIDKDHKLNLMIGDVPMMRFKKIADKQ